ncbi:MAG TPA: hypothetical protein VIJ26_09975 [Thermoanaerobaculia bacterium]
MPGKALWHHLRDSYFHYVMHHVWEYLWLYAGGGVLSVLGVVWAWLNHASPLVGATFGAFLVLFVVLTAATVSHIQEERKKETPEMRRRRKEISRYTNDGISWEPKDQSFVNDRAEVTILIRPMNSGDVLPQPVEFKIACAGIDEVLDVRHFPSGGNAGIHQFNPDDTGVLIRLDAPRLYGDGYVAVRLRSQGGAISVMGVKRNTKPLRPI